MDFAYAHDTAYLHFHPHSYIPLYQDIFFSILFFAIWALIAWVALRFLRAGSRTFNKTQKP